MKLKQYLKESKFKTSYKEGDEIKVDAERRPVYAHKGYVESAKTTKKTLKVVSKIKDNQYVVHLKGKKVRYAGGVSVTQSARLEIHKPDFGTLFTSSPKPAKWEVTPI